MSDKEMNNVSYSQYSLWANCPKAWQLKYVDGHRLDDGSIHTVFGTAMHETIQDWLQLLYGGKENLAKGFDLDDPFKEKLTEEFKKKTIVAEDGTKTFICDKPTLAEFFVQGTEILSYVQTHQKKFFPTQNIKLIGVEFPIEIEVRPGVQYVGYVDIITLNEKTGLMTLYDLKTSRTSWTQAQKSDKAKISQLLLYKKFIAEHFGLPLDKIRVEFVILKRTIIENNMYTIPRVTSFEPPNGKPSVNKAWSDFQDFLDDCFDEKGQHKTDTIKHKASKSTCRWCAFRDRKDLCEYGVK